MSSERHKSISLLDVIGSSISPKEHKIYREIALSHLVSPYVLLMQFAYPAIAKAGRDHSYGLANFPKRSYNTLYKMIRLFGENEQDAKDVAAEIKGIHERVAAKVPAAVDPDAIKWVWATLVDGVFKGHENFIGPLTYDQKQKFINFTKQRVAPIGLSDHEKTTLTTPEDHQRYIDGMISEGKVRVTADAQELAHKLFARYRQSKIFKIPNWYMGRITTTLLPDQLRRDYQLPYDSFLPRDIMHLKTLWRPLLQATTTELAGTAV